MTNNYNHCLHLLIVKVIKEQSPIAQVKIIDGDALSYCIAAASIIAKVTRDRMMAALHEIHPEYGWASNKGYGTEAHLLALKRHGATPHHRRSFAPVHNMLCVSNPVDST